MEKIQFSEEELSRKGIGDFVELVVRRTLQTVKKNRRLITRDYKTFGGMHIWEVKLIREGTNEKK